MAGVHLADWDWIVESGIIGLGNRRLYGYSQRFHAASTAFGYSGLPRLPL